MSKMQSNEETQLKIHYFLYYRKSRGWRGRPQCTLLDGSPLNSYSILFAFRDNPLIPLALNSSMLCTRCCGPRSRKNRKINIVLGMCPRGLKKRKFLRFSTLLFPIVALNSHVNLASLTRKFFVIYPS